MPIILNIHHSSGAWTKCQNVEDILDKTIQVAWQKINKPAHNNQFDLKLNHYEMGLVLADNDFIQNLNQTYRNKNQPTNVLSFPHQDMGTLLGGELELGDVIFAFETIEKEADSAKISLENHLSHLVIHGFLHLLGYDHIEDKDAEEMEKLESLILKDLDIASPYDKNKNKG